MLNKRNREFLNIKKEKRPAPRQRSVKILKRKVFLGFALLLIGILAFFLPPERIAGLAGRINAPEILQLRQIGFALVAAGGILLWSFLIRGQPE